MIAYPEARKLAAIFSAIGETTRMLILHRLVERERHVGELAELIGIPMVNMSHHLGVMRQAGILEDEKVGRKVVYRINPAIFVPAAESSDSLGVLHIQEYTINILRPISESSKTKGKISG
jgi:DNA-binding transcriptional ArsR family regulator